VGGTHAVAEAVDPKGTREGLRAIWISAGALAATAAFQLVVVAIGGSAGLFADALDNLGDVITTVTLAIAFVAARRAADRRYTFGYSRFEDLAGVFVVLVIWASAGLAAWESYRKLVGEHEVTALGLSLGAAGAGAIGNEVVARYKMLIGRRIGSSALVADGQHARTDALASVAAAAGLVGVGLGWEPADPVAGFVVTLAIVAIAWDASRHVLARLVDAVDPELISRIEGIVQGCDGVAGIGRIQARYAGRALYVSLTLAADGHMSLERAHQIAEDVHHRIIHEIPGVAQVDVHSDPWEAHGAEAHPETLHHAPETPPAEDHGHEH
jgi:cation diffusion facilitator family transporter